MQQTQRDIHWLVMFEFNINMSSDTKPSKLPGKNKFRIDKTSTTKDPQGNTPLSGQAVLDFGVQSNVDDEQNPTRSRDSRGRFMVFYRTDEDTTFRSRYPEPALVPGESILDIAVRPTLYKPSGWDMFYLGNAQNIDLNAQPACLGIPSMRQGFKDIVGGTTKCVCPFCFQTFRSQDLEPEHLLGPCQRFRARLMDRKRGERKKKETKGGFTSKGPCGLERGMD
jgi:hypothetical protein